MLPLDGQLGPLGRTYAAAAAASIWDSASHLWLLSEKSGSRADSIGAATLTDNNTVGYANMGPRGTVARFVAANSEYLDRAATVPRDGTSFTVAFWAYVPDPGAATSRWYMSQGNQTVWVSKQNAVMAIDVVGGGEAYATADISFAPVGWMFVVAGYNADTDKSFVSCNAGSTSVSAGTSTGVTTDANFQLGRVSGGGAGTVYFDDSMGRFGLWTGVLSDAVVQSLYNAGRGKSYADLTDAEKVGLVSYWNLDEASGNRADSHGSNTLTDNNTVGSTTNSYPANLPGRVANFVAANNESLSQSPLWGADADVSVALWLRLADTASEYSVVDSGGDGDFLFRAQAGAGGLSRITTRGFGDTCVKTPGVSSGAWHLMVAGHDPVSNQIWVSTDGSAKTTAATGGANGAPAAFIIGNRTGNIQPLTGMASVASVFGSTLTADQIAALWNGGDGAELPA